MPSTEIDAIFASKTKPPPVETASSSKLKGKAKATLGSSASTDLSGKKRKKKKKTADIDDNDPSEPSLQEGVPSVKRKRVEPETIIDPSLSVQAKRKKTTSVLGMETAPGRTVKRKTTEHDDVDKFRDSRGTGPRTYTIYPMCKLDVQATDSIGRKTEEGFSIYKEDELGIGDRGGG
jgi:hypothetical protein